MRAGNEGLEAQSWRGWSQAGRKEMSCRVMEGCGTSPRVSWADPQLFPGTGMSQNCARRDTEMSRALIYALWECAERLWEPCWPTFPANPSRRERSLRSISAAEPGASVSLGSQQLHTAQTAMGTGVPGLAGPPEDCPQPAGSLGPTEQLQDPHSRFPLSQTLPKAPARGRGHILPREGAKPRLKGFPGKSRERKGQAEGCPHLWGSVTSWPWG